MRLRSPAEILSEARSDISGILERALEKLGGLVSPSKIVASSITFRQGDTPIMVQLKLKRDLPVGPDEQRWMERYLSSEMGQPLVLNFQLLPFWSLSVFPPETSSFRRNTWLNSEDAISLYKAGAGPLLQIESQPESTRSRRDAALRLDAAKQYLTETGDIPADRIEAVVTKDVSSPPQLVLRFVPSSEAGRPIERGAGPEK